MKKVLYTVGAAAFLLGGLSACSNDEGALEQFNYKDGAAPIGYYSDENHNDNDGNQNQTSRITQRNDNDGPLTEILDRSGPNNVDRNRDNKVNIMSDRNRHRATPFNDGKAQKLKNDHWRTDKNYHGHLNDNDKRARTTQYDKKYDSQLAQRISDRAEQVANVRAARALVTEDNVVIGVSTNDHNASTIKEDIRKLVEPIVKGKNIHIVTDQSTFTRIREIDNNIRTGNTKGTLEEDIKDLMDSLGDTISKPFQNNNR